MRTKNSLKNIAVSLVLGFVAIIVNFIAQKFFVETLGVEYLGLNGLFTNVITMLSVAELGLGAAIVYHLYKPLKDSNEKKISSIMLFYKKSYRLIAFVIFALGLLIMPFLPLIVGKNTLDISTPLVYMLFIINVTMSYLLSFKRSILYADQKNYLINIIHIASLVVLNGLQIWALLATQNYYLYLILKIAMTMIENIVINTVVDRRYKLDYSAEPLDVNTKKDIFIKVKGLLYHKMGDFLVLGSTNIIISISLGIKMVGLYSNYFLIQMALTTLFTQMSVALRASIGNLLLGDTKQEYYAAFRKLQFANQILAVICISVFFVTVNSFIIWWLGSEYVFTIGIVAALSLNIYLTFVRSVLANFKEAAGIFYEDRYVPIVESIINIVASIVLIQFMGIAGAFIGTALSSLALFTYSYPKFVYKGVLGRNYREYALRMCKDLLITVVIVLITYLASKQVQISSTPGQFISNLMIAIIIPSVLLWIIYRNSNEFLYFKKLGGKMIYRIIHKK